MKKAIIVPISVLMMSVLAGAVTAAINDESLVTAVYSTVSNGYVRPKLADGSYDRETYAIANGGYSPGAARDRSIDGVHFPAIAGLVAQYLARQNYFLAENAKSANLLLVISWGKTVPFNDSSIRNQQSQFIGAVNHFSETKPSASDAGRGSDGIQSPAQAVNDAAKSELEGELLELQAFNSMRKRADLQNARLLGYIDEMNSRNDPSRFAGAGTYYNDLNSEIESERYYVIVTAYDFRSATQDKKQKLLWSTRVSIQSQGNAFNERLAGMMENASRLFGRESGSLIRKYQRTPRIDLKELKILGYDEPAKQN